MPYIERGENEEIISVQDRKQPGRAEEWVDENHVDLIAYRLLATILEKKSVLKSEMYRVLAEGFTWRETNADDWFTVSIDDDMQGFLTRTLLKLNEGRTNPHGGFIRSNNINTLIDDIGMRELCVFAGTWGDAIATVRITEIEAVVDWEAFDPYAVDWSINWNAQDAASGWNDNTLTQTP